MSQSEEDAKAAIDEAEKAVEQWKVKRLISTLESARGNGTSMISLIVPPKDAVSRVSKMLADELGTATNIKSRVNRLSVLGAITSVQQKLKLYNKVPNNGLVIYCGTVLTNEGKEKKVSIDFEPFKPINTSLYLCVDGESVVTMGDGSGRRLQDIVNTRIPAQIFAPPPLTENAPGENDENPHVANITNFMAKGRKECIEITIQDGRTLICTPDHRVMAHRDGKTQWIEAQHLLRSDRVICGLDGPVDDVDAAAESTWEMSGLGPMNTPTQRARVLAFARLAGKALTDGTLFINEKFDRPEGSFNIGHEADVSTLQYDLNTVVGTEGRCRSLESLKVAMPLSLAHLLAAADLPVGNRHKMEPRWPSWATSSDTPLSVLREFVAGLMGGEGYGPCINADRFDQQTIFSCHSSLELSPAMKIHMDELCAMLARLGVAGCKSQQLDVTWEGVPAHKWMILLPSTMGSTDFDTKVGFRYCVHKQARNAAAAVYRRIYGEHVRQRELLTNYVKEERSSGLSRSKAISAAILRAREDAGVLLDETAIRLSVSDLQKIEDDGAATDLAHPAFPSFPALMKEIGAYHMFEENNKKAYGVPRSTPLQPLRLSVRGIKNVGERDVFDISVDRVSSFTANGVVVHNCDNKFHTEALNELLESDEKFGFIVMDGNGALFGTLTGNTRTILHKFNVELPKKHGRGGQSALRFARLRLEKRHNYLRKVAETAVQMFIENDKANVSGLILAGSAEFKVKLSQSDMFDQRLQAIVVKIVDVSYGGENGFNQAIELASSELQNVKFLREKKLLSTYFAEIARDSGRFCFGIRDTLAALEMGSVEEIIVYENLDINRYKVKNKETGEEKVLHLSEKQEGDSEHFKDPKTGAELEMLEKQTLLEWLANSFKSFGAKLNFVTNKSQEGSQFVRGFGGIGGILRYQVDFLTMDVGETQEEEDDFL